MKVPRWLARIRASSAQAEMSFFDHLEELRSVIIISLVTLVVLAIGAWFISGWLLDFLVTHTVGQAQFIKPQEAFYTRLKLSLLAAALVGMPFIAYQVWSFVVPGLFRKEKRVVLPLVVWSTLLFLIGVAFSVLVLTPTMLKFLASFGSDVVQADLAVGYLLDFYMRMAIACGILFQLPLVIAVLSFFGIVTPGFLKSKWRHAILLILILSAIVTPADAASQLMLGVPIVLLYFISIFVSVAIYKSRGKEEEDEPDGDDEPDGSRDAGGGPGDADGGPGDETEVRGDETEVRGDETEVPEEEVADVPADEEAAPESRDRHAAADEWKRSRNAHERLTPPGERPEEDSPESTGDDWSV